jgi:hypothetical protein
LPKKICGGVADSSGLEEANAQLCTELIATQSKLPEVEHRKQAMNSSNEVLKKDFDEMHSSHAAVVKEKEEKMECEM